MRPRLAAVLVAAGVAATTGGAGLALAGCGGGEGEAAATGGERLRVATTVAPITSIVATVAGDLAEVRGLVPEGVNSHTFEPPPSAARALATAEVVFVNGLRLEEPIRTLAAENLRDGSEIVELGDATLPPEEYIFDFSFPRAGGRPNPHLWTNPPMARRYARVVADALARHDPGHAARYEANYEAFAERVHRLDRALRAATATVTEEHRLLLTYHDAFAYFAREYGWKVIGAIQPSSFEEPTPRDVAALIRQVRATGVPAIFGSEVFPSPVLAQIGRETGVRYVDVLRDDDLPGKPGDPEHSWLGLMQYDYATIVEALGGDATPLEALDVAGAVADRARYPQ